MKGFYGSGSHDSKLEDYTDYMKKKYKHFEEKIYALIEEVKSTSLSEDDKVELIETLSKRLLFRIAKRVK